MVAQAQIPNLTAGIALDGSELFESVQAGSSVRLTAAQIATYVLSQGVSVDNDYANDAAAAAGGIPVGALYHNAGALRVRIV